MKLFKGMSLAIALVLVATLTLSGAALAAPSNTVKIGLLQPAWALGVFSAYVGPPDYNYVSPGSTAVYLGREAGIIKAGLTADTDGHYYDEGLFAFKPAITIDRFAALPLTYDVVNQYGTNPVWMTIELDTGVVGDRSDNTIYQFVPAPYGSTAYITVNAGTGNWYEWASNDGTITGGAMTLTDIAAAYPGATVIHTYLRLGMGDSYASGTTGTVAWVDKASIGGVTYDFVLNWKGSGAAQKDWSTNPGNHGFQNP